VWQIIGRNRGGVVLYANLLAVFVLKEAHKYTLWAIYRII
jgi:hypothetical protein